MRWTSVNTSDKSSASVGFSISTFVSPKLFLSFWSVLLHQPTFCCLFSLFLVKLLTRTNGSAQVNQKVAKTPCLLRWLSLCSAFSLCWTLHYSADIILFTTFYTPRKIRSHFGSRNKDPIKWPHRSCWYFALLSTIFIGFYCPKIPTDRYQPTLADDHTRKTVQNRATRKKRRGILPLRSKKNPQQSLLFARLFN